jgi:hypothetical protein
MVPVLFLGGVVFCYLVVLPPALDFLLSFNASEFNTQLRASDYYSFATLTMAAMGLGFQVPVGVLVISRLGVVTWTSPAQPPLRDPGDRRHRRPTPHARPDHARTRDGAADAPLQAERPDRATLRADARGRRRRRACARLINSRLERDEAAAMKRGDNTVTTNTLSTRSKSSTIPSAMFASAAVGRDGQGLGQG